MEKVICENCQGRGEINTGTPAGFSACSSSWALCDECHGEGVIYTACNCERCLDTGIDLEAPVNLANPPACPVCHPAPEPTPAPGTITVGGHMITAPGFTADSFDRAIQRAHANGLTVEPTDRSDMVLVTNPTHGTCYTVSRERCDCRAGQQGTGCMHRALAIAVNDLYHDLPTAAVAA